MDKSQFLPFVQQTPPVLSPNQQPLSPPHPQSLLPSSTGYSWFPSPVLADQPASTAVAFGKQPAAKHGLPLATSTFLCLHPFS